MPLQSKRVPPQGPQTKQNGTSGFIAQLALNNSNPLVGGAKSDHRDIERRESVRKEVPRNSTLPSTTTNETTHSHDYSPSRCIANTQASKPSASSPPADHAVVGPHQYQFGHFDGFERSHPRTPIPPPHLFRFHQREIPSTPYQPPRHPARDTPGASRRLPFDTPGFLRGSSAFSSSSGDRVQGLEDPFVDTHTRYHYPRTNYIPWNSR